MEFVSIPISIVSLDRSKAGDHDIDVFASVVGRKAAVHLATIGLTLKPYLAAALARRKGVLFERRIGGEYEGIRDMMNPMGLPTGCSRPVPPAIFEGL